MSESTSPMRRRLGLTLCRRALDKSLLNQATHPRANAVESEDSRDLQRQLLVRRPAASLTKVTDCEIDLLRRDLVQLSPRRRIPRVRNADVDEAVPDRPQKGIANLDRAARLSTLDGLLSGGDALRTEPTYTAGLAES